MARLTFLLVSTLTILAIINSCGEDSVVGPPAIVPVTVAFGESKTVPYQGATITFEVIVRDSRCKVFFPCLWEGLAEITIKVSLPASSGLPSAEHLVRLPILGGANPTKPETLMPVDILGYRITLLELSPFLAPDNDSEYIATIELYKYSPPDTLTGRLNISNIPPENIMLHSFWLDTANIESDRIHLSASYSGGCRKHYFWLYMSPPAFAKSNPVQADFYLRHWSEIDYCDAIITEELTFDLGPMIEMYQEQFGTNDDIIVNMHHYSTTLPAEKTVLRYYGSDSP